MRAAARFYLCLAGLIAFAPFSGFAKDDEALGLLEAHCVKCHGGEKTKGGLNLLTREGLLSGGDSGAAVTPGQPGSSLLLELVRHLKEPEMPENQRKLPESAITTLADWIEAGVPYSRPLQKALPPAQAAEFNITPEERKHWAFQPVKRPPPPYIEAPGAFAMTAVDRFLLVRLRAKGLSFSPPAPKEQLLRRAKFDLVGLPPTPEEIEAFLNDHSASAFERLLDRFLASHEYGERWARHWLDLARYAETDGFEHDAIRPHSWRYRDYVIKAFNDDKPYDRFILEQIAGDELWPDDPEALTATGFNLLGPDMVDSADQVQRRHNTLNDMTDTASLAFLGLTMGCARCHDHKLEPLSQRDYYQMQAYFSAAKFEREKPIPTAEARAAHEAALEKFRAHPANVELAAFEDPIREAILKRKIAALPAEAQAAHLTAPSERSVEQANLVLETSDKVVVAEKDIASALGTDEEKARWKQLTEAVKRLPRPRDLPRAMAMGQGAGGKTFILHRGEHSQPGDEVTPAPPTILRATGMPSDSTRAGFAQWIASPANPLTARVMVNRLWQRHFGRGLVATPSDFGLRGERPTHPELLDWLAAEFVEGGWSIKRMHKLLMMSAAYQQSSQTPRSAIDPENKLYGRMNRQRLEGEAIRDSLLAISGQLNPQVGGPGVYPPIPKELFQGATGWSAAKNNAEHSRRSIYIFARRNLRFPFLEVFDAPDSNLSCPQRERSATAPQALTLLNADEVVSAADKTAAQLRAQASDSGAQVARAFTLILGRNPTPDETKLALAFVAEHPLEEFCRALFNLNQFIYVE